MKNEFSGKEMWFVFIWFHCVCWCLLPSIEVKSWWDIAFTYIIGTSPLWLVNIKRMFYGQEILGFNEDC